jgi:hypothetical protein
MKVTRQDIVQLSMTKTGVYNRIYTDFDGNTYRGLEDRTLKKLTDAEVTALEERSAEAFIDIETDLTALEARTTELERVQALKADKCYVTASTALFG